MPCPAALAAVEREDPLSLVLDGELNLTGDCPTERAKRKGAKSGPSGAKALCE